MSKSWTNAPVNASSKKDGIRLLQTRRLDHCQFRVLGRHDRLGEHGDPRCSLRLGNLAGTALIHIDPLSSPQWWQSLKHGDVISISGELRAFPSQWEILAESAYTPCESELRPTALFPCDWVLPAFKPQLKAVVRHWNNIKDDRLRAFLANIFSDAANAMGFLNVPGSLIHHHAYQGGLLDHTADMLIRFGGCHPKANGNLERDLVTTLILTHDIGKTATLVGEGRGKHQPHDMAALELMAQPLVELEARSPVLANIIRGNFRPRSWLPKTHHRAYVIVSGLDRSSGASNDLNAQQYS